MKGARPGVTPRWEGGRCSEGWLLRPGGCIPGTATFHSWGERSAHASPIASHVKFKGTDKHPKAFSSPEPPKYKPTHPPAGTRLSTAHCPSSLCGRQARKGARAGALGGREGAAPGGAQPAGVWPVPALGPRAHSLEPGWFRERRALPSRSCSLSAVRARQNPSCVLCPCPCPVSVPSVTGDARPSPPHTAGFRLPSRDGDTARAVGTRVIYYASRTQTTRTDVGQLPARTAEAPCHTQGNTRRGPGVGGPRGAVAALKTLG